MKSTYEPQATDSGRPAGRDAVGSGLGSNHKPLPDFRGTAACEQNLDFGLDEYGFAFQLYHSLTMWLCINDLALWNLRFSLRDDANLLWAI